jgi:hypothetical protein
MFGDEKFPSKLICLGEKFGLKSVKLENLILSRRENVFLMAFLPKPLNSGRQFAAVGHFKSRFTGLFNTTTSRVYCILTPTSSRIHLQRCHASYRCARPLPAKAGTLPPNFASRSVIYKNPLGSFTCRKAGTWDILFYSPSEGRHTEDFSDAGFEPANLGSSGQYANH